MLQQVHARDLQVGDILDEIKQTIEDISVKPDRVTLVLSGQSYAKLKPDDVVVIVARSLPASW